MMILNQVHGKLSGIADDLPTDTITGKSLLQQYISAVFFIGQNMPNFFCGPFLLSIQLGNALGFKPLLDHANTVSGQKISVDFSYYLRLFRDDFGLTVLTLFISR